MSILFDDAILSLDNGDYKSVEKLIELAQSVTGEVVDSGAGGTYLLSSNDYQSIAIFESSLNKASAVSEKSDVCQRLDKAECNDIKQPPLDELYKTIWEMVSAPYSSIDGKWKSAINGGKGISFLPQYFSHLNESSKYYSSWWSNLINVEGKYGLILYPPGMDQFRVIFGVPSKDDIIQYQCVFAPKQ